MQKILLIDKVHPERAATLQLIESAGYTAAPADDGQSGIRIAQQHQPTLILCGWDIGDMNGHQVLTVIRQDPELALIPFILLTDRADRAHLRRSMELGADDCLVRPFADQELTAAIATRLKLQTTLTNRYVTVLRHAAERLNRLTHYDSLTDLPNHRLLQQRLSQAILKAQAEHKPVALLSLSLDRLRQV
jgi:PleD family two-component response regulator